MKFKKKIAIVMRVFINLKNNNKLLLMLLKSQKEKKVIQKIK